MKSASANNFQPVFALLLSLVPGLSHLYLNRYKKAAGLLLISAGIGVTLLTSGSLVMKFLVAIIYVATAIPAALETYQMARMHKYTAYTSHRWYIVLMLLSTGFSALPLLWQSHVFSKPAKISWTIAVPILAVLFFTVLARYWDRIDSFLERLVT